MVAMAPVAATPFRKSRRSRFTGGFLSCPDIISLLYGCCRTFIPTEKNDLSQRYRDAKKNDAKNFLLYIKYLHGEYVYTKLRIVEIFRYYLTQKATFTGKSENAAEGAIASNTPEST